MALIGVHTLWSQRGRSSRIWSGER